MTAWLSAVLCCAQKSENHHSSLMRNLETFTEIYRQLDLLYMDSLNTDTVMICSDKGAQPVPVVLTSMVEEDFSFLSDKALAKAPAATIADERLDCKRLSRGSSVTLTTSITNAGGGDKLAVRRIYSNSPAVKVAADKDSIKKGKSAKLTVTVDTSALPADSHIVNATVTVVTNDPAHPRRELRVVGEIFD